MTLKVIYILERFETYQGDNFYSINNRTINVTMQKVNTLTRDIIHVTGMEKKTNYLMTIIDIYIIISSISI